MLEFDIMPKFRQTTDAARSKSHGEIFTPVVTVNQMLDLLDPDVWSDPATCLVENSCGDGIFVIEILRRRFAGLDDGIRSKVAIAGLAIGSVWGVELQTDNVSSCRANAMRLILAFLGTDDLAMIAAFAAAVEWQIRHGDGLKFIPRDETPFLMLPSDEQGDRAAACLTTLETIKAGKPVDSWLGVVVSLG